MTLYSSPWNMSKPEEVRGSGVELAERVRKLDPIQNPNSIPFADAHQHRGALTGAIESEDCGFVERRGVERASGL